MTNKENPTLQPRRNQENYNSIDFLISLMTLELSEEDIISIPSADILPSSYTGLVKYINIHKYDPNFIPSLKEQVDLHTKLALQKYELDQVKRLFEAKSMGILSLETYIISFGKSGLPLSNVDIEYIRKDILGYKQLYTLYRQFDSDRLMFGEERTEKTLIDLQNIFVNHPLDTQKIQNYLQKREKFVILYNESNEVLYLNSQFSAWFEGNIRKESPYQRLLELFSTYYTRNQDIKLLDGKREEKYTGKGLNINLEEGKEILKNIFQLYPEIGEKQLPYDITFTLLGGQKLSLKNGLSQITQQTLPAPQNNKKKDSLSESKDFSILLSELQTHESFPRKISFTHKNKSTRIFSSEHRPLELITQNLLEYPTKKTEIFQFLFSELPSGNRQSLEVLKIFFRKNILTSEECYKILEGKSGFQKGGITLSEVIRVFGFSDRVLSSFETILGTKLDTKKMKNIAKFFEYFLFMESSGGYNVANYTGESSAQGYFQYLTKNGKTVSEILDPSTEKFVIFQSSNTQHKKWKEKNLNTFRTVRLDNSYETGLRRVLSTSSIPVSFPVFVTEKRKIGKPHLQSPKSLTSEEQMVLFFADIYKKAQSSIEQIVMTGNISHIEEAYQAHHTNASGDKATKARMQMARKILDNNPSLFAKL